MHHFTIRSSDGRTPLHAVMWQPQGKPVAILQIAHGMIEFIERYDAFAQYLCAQGFLVVGHDHLGHGASIHKARDWGHFADQDGFKFVVKDLHVLRRHVQAKYPNLPYFMLGHSMGSFALRTYISRHPRGLSGVIIMGTGNIPAWKMSAAVALGSIVSRVLGPRHRSALLTFVTLGSLNNPYRQEGKNAWLTRDKDIVAAYNNEPRCSFRFTAASYTSMYKAMLALHDMRTFDTVPRDLPVLLISGKADPLGGMGKRIEALYGIYQSVGMQNVTLKLIPDCRHEVLNELNREEIFADLYRWITAQLPAVKD